MEATVARGGDDVADTPEVGRDHRRGTDNHLIGPEPAMTGTT